MSFSFCLKFTSENIYPALCIRLQLYGARRRRCLTFPFIQAQSRSIIQRLSLCPSTHTYIYIPTRHAALSSIIILFHHIHYKHENLTRQVEERGRATERRQAEGDVGLGSVRVDQGVPPHVAGAERWASNSLPVSLGVLHAGDGITLLRTTWEKENRR